VIAAAALLLATNFSPSDRLSENWYESLTNVDVVQVHRKYFLSIDVCIVYTKWIHI
jgi:hypothetical protein